MTMELAGEMQRIRASYPPLSVHSYNASLPYTGSPPPINIANQTPTSPLLGSFLKESELRGLGIKPETEDFFPWIHLNDSKCRPKEQDEEQQEEEEYDTDLEEDPHGLPVADSVYVYRAGCRRYGVLPLTVIITGLSTQSLSIRHQGLSTKDIRVIALAMVSNLTVEYVDLSGNDLGTQGSHCLAEALRQNRYVTKLSLCDASIGSNGVIHLCSMLEENTTIRVLSLAGNNLVDRDAIHIARVLQKNESLKEFDLSHNSFRQHGGIILASALGENEYLLRVDLSWNHLRLQGAVCLAEALQDNKTLEHLDVSWNGFGNDGGRAIGRGLIFNTSVTYLDLSCNRINLEGAKGIAAGLRHNATLKILKLNRNPITTVGACRLLQVCQETSTSVVSELHLLDIAVDHDFECLLERDADNCRTLAILHGGFVNHADPYARRTKKKKTTLGDPLSLLMEYVKQQSLRLWDMFAQLDKDNSQSVSRKEFLHGMKEAKVPLNDDQIEKLMDKLDKNKDGEISFDELLDGQKRYRDRERKKRASLLPSLLPASASTIRHRDTPNAPVARVRSATVSMITPLGNPLDNLAVHLPSLKLVKPPEQPPIPEEDTVMSLRKMGWAA